ncbi:MAG TPA: helix-turn-helix transcriptional regulator [Trebonia sp.]|nr:helix-turn-helix transcriptional regulator [Trebonia sp.]
MEVSPLRRLGDAIRKRREALSLNQTELGKLVLMSKSNISRIELGELAIETANIELFDKALKADGLLCELWAFVMAGDYSAALITSQEEKASRILEYDNRVFPGLLQTADYSRAVMRAVRQFDSDDQIDRDVRERIERQSIWRKESPPAGWFVIDESVLHRPFGGVQVMREQLDNVLEMAGRRRIFIQVARFSAVNHPGTDGPLRVIFYPGAPTLAYTESLYSGSTNGTDADEAATNFDIIRSASMPPAESVEYIRTIKEKSYGND